MEILTDFWNNQPTTVMGIGVAIIIIIRNLLIFTPDISINLVNYFFNFF